MGFQSNDRVTVDMAVSRLLYCHVYASDKLGIYLKDYWPLVCAVLSETIFGTDMSRLSHHPYSTSTFRC